MIGTETYVGPARVTRVGSEGPEVTFPDGDTAPARMALAFPYRPAFGDELLTIRQDGGAAYVIGVLQGTGPCTIRTPGDLTIEAPNGTLTLAAPHVQVRAGRMEVTAQRILEKARDVYRWISDLFQIKSRRARCDVQEDYRLLAGRASLRAEGDMNIDGTSINLG